MTHADLHPSDLSSLLRLAAEVGELPRTESVRRRHILDTLRRLVGGETAACHEPGSTDNILFSPNTAQQKQFYEPYLRTGAPRDPAEIPIVRRASPTITSRRAELVADQLWYTSDHYHKVLVPMDLDDALYSRICIPDGRTLLITIHRAEGNHPFTDRDCQLVQTFNACAAHLYQCSHGMRRPLVFAGASKSSVMLDPDDPRMAGLPPRLHPVLRQLLAGDAEKQVALKLGLSPHTVHQYAKLLHRHFRVSSRAELLSQFIRPTAHILPPHAPAEPTPLPW